MPDRALSAVREVASRARAYEDEMIAAFRGMFSDEVAASRTPGKWDDPALRSMGLTVLPSTLATRQLPDDLFFFARSSRFLQAQASATSPWPSQDSAGPLKTLDLALDQAIQLDRIPEMVAFTLSRALWGRKLTNQTPLAGLRTGDRMRAQAMADSYPAEQAALWYLLLAWHLHDAGNRDQARELLRDLVNAVPPELPIPYGRRAVVLLRHAADIDVDIFCDLQRRVLDDNDRTDLCRQLTEAAEFERVLAVAGTITLFPRNRVAVLAEAAKAAAAAGKRETAHAAAAHAAAELERVEAGADQPFGGLAQVAGAQALCGDQAAAEAMFARALASSQRPGTPPYALRVIAVEQAAAGLFRLAAQTIRQIADPHDRWEALEALAVGYAHAGQTETAVSTLARIDLCASIDRRRVVRNVARALAAAGRIDAAADVAGLLDGGERAGPLAAVAHAAACAGDVERGLQIAGQIADPDWQARAMADIAAELTNSHPAQEAARTAANHVADPELRARLLAELAVTQTGEEREKLFAEAVRLAGSIEGERWRLLLTIGVAQVKAASPRAGDTFTYARQSIRASEDDPWWGDELWELGTAQAQAGDTAGARETFAEALQGPTPQPEQWLRPLVIAGIAVTQFTTGQADAARRTCQLATQSADSIHGWQRALVNHAVAEAQAATGDREAAIETALGILAIAEDDGEDDALNAAVEHGVSAGVSAALELAEAGDQDRARQALADIAETAGPWLRQSSSAYRDAIAELACAQAQVGDWRGAAGTAAWDETWMAADRTQATVAKHQAGGGDIDAALGTARHIRLPETRAAALSGIASALAARGDHAAAREVFAKAVAQAHRSNPPQMIVRTLIQIAAAQAEARDGDGARATFRKAHEAVTSIAGQDSREQALSQIAQGWARHGDSDRAGQIAREIRTPYLAGEALLAAALASGRLSRDWDHVAALVNSIENPGWRAVGLAVVAAAETVGSRAETSPHFAEAGRLINQIPEGHDRARLQDMIIEAMLECGNYEVALHIAKGMITDRNARLSRLVGRLGADGNVNAVKRLLRDCAHYVDAAYLACRSLAQAEPAYAQIIANEVTASG